jgi:RecB family exonuclease
MYSQPPIRRLNAETRAHRPKIEPVVGLKNETVVARLEAYCDNRPDSPYFSPSSLTTLMACELRFYFQYLLKIDERDEFSTTIEHDEIGKLLHTTLELFYMGNVEKKKPADPDGYVKRYGPKLDKTRLEKHLGELDEFIAAAMRAERIDPDELRSGENLLRFRVVHEMARQIVLADIQAADRHEIQILDAEKKVFTRISIDNGQRTVNIGGSLDRIDRRDGKYYILDYKTGRGGLSVRYDSQNDTLSYDPYTFQGLMYAWVLAEIAKSSGQACMPPAVGFYMPALGGETLRILPDTLWTSDDKKPSAYDEIPALIDTLLTEIYSPEHAFLQTDQRKECTYCPYNGICFRN